MTKSSSLSGLKRSPALFLMGASLLLSFFTISSCNGNGGASDAGGEIYTGGVQALAVADNLPAELIRPQALRAAT